MGGMWLGWCMVLIHSSNPCHRNLCANSSPVIKLGCWVQGLPRQSVGSREESELSLRLSDVHCSHSRNQLYYELAARQVRIHLIQCNHAVDVFSLVLQR